MKIFLLDDSPIVLNGLRADMENEHDVRISSTLIDAADSLENNPGVGAFDLFLFDVYLPSEIVTGFKKDKTVYDEPFGYNGLLFLLNNLDILKSKINYIAIFSAFKNQIITMKNFNVFGKHYNVSEYKKYASNELDKLVFKSGLKEYVFTFLDKGRNTIMEDVKRFIEESYT